MPIINEPVHDTAAPNINNEYGFPLREDVAFTGAKGEPKPAAEKSARKLISKIAAPLQRTLEPGETVFWVSQAVPPMSILEQLTMSWVMYRYYSVALVFTDRRLIAFGVTSTGVWRGSVKSLAWNRVTKASTTGWLSQGLKLKVDNKTVLYGRLGVRNTKKIKTLVQFLTGSNQAQVVDSASTEQPESLCGRCSKPLMRKTYSCQHCGLEFKNEQTLALRTLIPGGAYFYTGLTGIGVLTALIECLFLLALVGTLLEPASTDRSGMIAYFVFIIGFEKLISYMHARRFVQQFEPARIADTTSESANAAAGR